VSSASGCLVISLPLSFNLSGILQLVNSSFSYYGSKHLPIDHSIVCPCVNTWALHCCTLLGKMNWRNYELVLWERNFIWMNLHSCKLNWMQLDWIEIPRLKWTEPNKILFFLWIQQG
jgi:hypothetical protein